MNLSELVTGQEAYISQINGDSAVKHRIHEMGFVGGTKVKAIKAAPFKDPIEYEIMGYKLTIRRKDAEMIKVEREVSEKTVLKQHKFLPVFAEAGDAISHKNSNKNKNIREFTVALVGNPNCGKTTIFNFATKSRERVANYSGVTVAAKEASFKIDDHTINVIDLPGTYSLKPYSPEELFVYDYLANQRPDLVINVIDAGNIERNLFLTTQLIDLGIDTVVAFNMYDELKKTNTKIDIDSLGKMLGIPFIPTIGKKGVGINDLFRAAIEVYQSKNAISRKVNISYGKEIDDAIAVIQVAVNKVSIDEAQLSKFEAIQLLEGTTMLNQQFGQEVNDFCSKSKTKIEKQLGHRINTEVVNTRYGYVQGALAETCEMGKKQKINLSQKVDSVLTHKLLGLPIFFGIIWFIFFATFKLGEIPMNGIDGLFGWLGGIASGSLPDTAFTTLLVDGIIGGVGGVIIFLPNIMILFFLISLLEDSGYMARTAFLMDKTMHKAGLHGKSFIPLLMGFGCNIPAVMATRTIESKRDRMVTMFIIPFISCSARLPVYVLFISAFFPTSQSLIMFSIYTFGVLAAFVTAILLNKTFFKKAGTPFVMELPPYRMPTLKAVGKHTWYKTSHFVKKMGTIILFASILVWALGYFPRDKEIIAKYDQQAAALGAAQVQDRDVDAELNAINITRDAELLEQSYISRIGKFLEPVFAPLGFDWKMSVSVLTGVMAKEVVVSSMGVLYHAGSDADETSQSLISKLRADRDQRQVPARAYLSFLIFVLLYFPCLGTLIAIKKETAGMRWTLMAAIYPLVFAWLISFGIYQIGGLF